MGKDSKITLSIFLFYAIYIVLDHFDQGIRTSIPVVFIGLFVLLQGFVMLFFSRNLQSVIFHLFFPGFAIAHTLDGMNTTDLSWLIWLTPISMLFGVWQEMSNKSPKNMRWILIALSSLILAQFFDYQYSAIFSIVYSIPILSLGMILLLASRQNKILAHPTKRMVLSISFFYGIVVCTHLVHFVS